MLKRELANIDKMFDSYANIQSVHEKKYSDEEKMAFYLNFFNIRLMHQMFFGTVMGRKMPPGDRKEWRKWMKENEFRLFGVEMSLWDLEISVIR